MEGFDFTLAQHGTVYVNDTVETAVNAKALYIAEDTVISSIKYRGSATNVVADMISDPTAPVKQFTILTPVSGNVIEFITLTSGSIAGIKAAN